ncbi:MAG: HAD-IA family hydrolase [Clostridia bacterium]|nr:HAD-IA family hydrolase [Clostridia bacterium]
MNYLFDMDGVLVYSEPVTKRAAIEVLAEYGIQAKLEDFRPFIGAGEARFVGGVAEKYGVPYEPAMKDKTYAKYVEYVKEGLTVYPGAKEVLATLKAGGHKVALCSSADFIKIEANMKGADIPLDWFDALVCGDDAERKKPFPDIFLAAARLLEAEASRCLVIEDAINGIQAAKAAGMRCAAVTTSFNREQLTEEAPDFIIDSLNEIPDLAL